MWHIASEDNHVADDLSHALVSAISFTEFVVDFSVMAAVQQIYGEMDTSKAASGLQLEDVSYGTTQDLVLCDSSSGQPHSLMPISRRCKVFHAIHDLSQTSIRASDVYRGGHPGISPPPHLLDICHFIKEQI